MTNHLTKLRQYLFVLVVMVFASAIASATVTVTVSTPSTSTATVSSPAKVVAKATSSTGKPITSWYIYSDGNPVWHTTSDVSSISASFALSSGKHSMTIRAWDGTGTHGTQYMTFNVSGTSTSAPTTSGVPVAPSNAKVISAIETKGPWGHCSDCAANPADSTPPIAQWVF